MEFIKYNSIENSYREKFMDYVWQLAIPTWVVQEKVHGANVVLAYDGTDFKYGRRRNWIEPNEKFFNIHAVADRYENSMKTLWQSVEGGEVRVYGEIFGGSFPGIKVHNAARVNKGVYYTPGNEIYAFDVMVDGLYLNVDEANRLLVNAEFFFAPTLFRGPLKECLKYPNDFESLVPGWLGYDPPAGNICEGVVIKPIEPQFSDNGKRVILKNKNEKFTESVAKRKPKPITKLSETEQQILAEAQSMITENRLRNILSQIGPIGQKEFGRLLGSLSKDIVIELRKDHKIKDKEKHINRMVNKLCADFIRSRFQNIVDGRY